MIISIYKDDVQLYNGVYTPSSYLISAYQNNNSFDFYFNGHEWGLFELSLNTIAEIALLKATSHMGSWLMFIAILFFVVILIVDICFPLLFFKIKYCLSVNDPEPTELFWVVKEIIWKLSPIILIIIFVYGLFIQV